MMLYKGTCIYRNNQIHEYNELTGICIACDRKVAYSHADKISQLEDRVSKLELMIKNMVDHETMLDAFEVED